ncbi:MAG TPA: hypothetical protein VGN43_14650 [Steroidobacteraceae bacterium]|nr:hypothetical protein [Steroidobacteraceae bacterium]
MKASRLLLLATAQLCWAGLCSQPALAGTVSSAWSDLWRTPDQQGQALLAAGQAAKAADRFQDPRRQAYADLEAGRYRQAAKLLAPFTDAQSQYNRGNALAKAGQLQPALAAYDAALKQAPGDKDIRHNRDLVERALRRQHQSQQSASHNGRQGKQGGQSAGSQGQQPPQSAAGQQNGSGSPQSGGGSPQPGGTSQQSGAGGQPSAGSGQTASNGSRTGGSQPGNVGAQNSGPGAHPQPSAPPQAGGAAGTGASREPPGQAQRDAQLAAALARGQGRRGAPGVEGHTQGSNSGATAAAAPKEASQTPGTRNRTAGGAQTPRQKPESERQLALDQWLRQIPDSPAGLLQRKFLIEHMMKQQDSGDAQESGQ